MAISFPSTDLVEFSGNMNTTNSLYRTITINVRGMSFLGSPLLGLCEHVPNHVAMDVGQPARRAVVVVGEPLVVEAEQWRIVAWKSWTSTTFSTAW